MEKRIEYIEKKISSLEKILGLDINYYIYLDPEEVAIELNTSCLADKEWSCDNVFTKNFCNNENTSQRKICNNCYKILAKYKLPLKIIGGSF